MSEDALMSFEEWRDTTRKLADLFADPHPGLFTWNDAVNTHIKRIISAWETNGRDGVSDGE